MLHSINAFRMVILATSLRLETLIEGNGAANMRATQVEVQTKWQPLHRHFSFLCMKSVSSLTQMSPSIVPKGPINNIPALFQILAW